MKSKIVRINNELAKEIQRIAKTNKIKFIDASSEVAKLMRQKRNTKVTREIQF